MAQANLVSEKNWWSIILTPITVLPNGRISVTSTKYLKVKQLISLSKIGHPNKVYQIKKVFSDTEFAVGDPKTRINSLLDPSVYDGGSAMVYEQQRNTIADSYVIRSVYEEEPTMALRVLPVDWLGNLYDHNNPLPVSVISEGAVIKNPYIYNVDVSLKDTEYSQQLPSNTAQFSIRSRKGDAKLQLSYNANETDTNFFTLRPGTVMSLNNLVLTNRTIYFRSSKPNNVIEIQAWTI